MKNDNLSKKFTLSNLEAGKEAIVESLNFENNALRRHILDMGLTPGVEVTMIKAAPLGDPLEIRLRGYDLTLRKHDAKKIFLKDVHIAHERKTREIILKNIEHSKKGEGISSNKKTIKNNKAKISFALIGNQNSGKTTLFNKLTGSNQHVGNFPGVTVDKKQGFVTKNKNIKITDLPGIYSLSPYSNEEMVTREFLFQENPDGIINIIDATNIERGLFLTTQLMELNIPMVIALNMMDEVANNNGVIDINQIEEVLGVPVVPISATNNQGIDELLDHAINVVRYKEAPKNIDFCESGESKDGAVHRAIHAVVHLIEESAKLSNIPYRFASTKVIEKDSLIIDSLNLNENDKKTINEIIDQLEKETSEDSELSVSNMRYNFIEKLCQDCVYRVKETKESKFSFNVDKLLTGKYTAFLIFLLLMGLIFYVTFGPVGTFFMDLIQGVVDKVSEVTDNILTSYGLNDVVKSLIIDGVFVGVGSVLSFIPYIVILFFFLSLLEDSGYMARVAFFMDKVLRKIGLSGRSFVPMLIGFGCSVPAIMSARTLPSERDRKMTIFLIPFMSCTAKLPIYVLFTAAFFRQNQVWVLLSLYLIGIIVGVFVSYLLKILVFRGKPVPFVMELPNYRMPNPTSVYRLIYTKSKNFVTKAFTIIFWATIVVWFLQKFDLRLNVASDIHQSILASIGNLFLPIFKPLGITDWRICTSFISGFIAKESVVSSLTVLLGDVDMLPQVFTTLSAFVFMVFALLYTPCVATIATVKRELGAFYSTLIVIFQCVVAWIVALIVYQLGSMIGL